MMYCAAHGDSTVDEVDHDSAWSTSFTVLSHSAAE